jgi:mono/diheme cytochrome c family protein
MNAIYVFHRKYIGYLHQYQTFWKGMKSAFPLIIALIMFSACSNSSSSDKVDSQVKTTQPNAEEKGKTIFQAKCAACHGVDGDAGIAGAANLQINRMDTASLIQVVRNGKGGMPSFKNSLSEMQLQKIVSYVRCLRK